MNDIINISNRLKCVASLVNKGARVADIGTDHAYLPIYLVQNGISNKVYACDVRKEPLRRAQLHIDEYGLSDKITTQLCDGLKGINKGDVDTVTICGMGGKLMKSILQAGIDKLGYNTQLVLSAQSELRDFRAYLLEAGIDIKSENITLYLTVYTTRHMNSILIKMLLMQMTFIKMIIRIIMKKRLQLTLRKN